MAEVSRDDLPIEKPPSKKNQRRTNRFLNTIATGATRVCTNRAAPSIARSLKTGAPP